MASRRKFLIGSAAIAGGFIVGYKLYSEGNKNALDRHLSPNQTALNPYVIIDNQGITIITPRAEMGQGIHSTLATLVAEELDITTSKVKVIHGPASRLYSNYTMFPRGSQHWKKRIRNYFTTDPERDSRQLTGGQTSIRDSFYKMREAGAAAREILLMAAAQLWDTSPKKLKTANGIVENVDGKRISYQELASLASSIAPPEKLKLKSPDQWKYLGKSQPRVDMADKCKGSAKYSIDIELPDMLYGAVRLNPNLGGKMISFQADEALRMPGVKEIVPLSNGVVICATNTWYAFQALKEVQIEWESAPYPNTSSEHQEEIRKALNYQPNSQPRDIGNVSQSFESAEKVEAEYWVPYLAHANMEPLCAVAQFHEGELDIWAGTQYPTSARLTGADILEIGIDKVRVHTTYMGCGFGRRLETDFIETAVHAAKKLRGKPVKVTWSREEDMTHDVYRPMSMAKFKAFVGQGKVFSLDLKVSSPSLLSSFDDRAKEKNPKVIRDKFITAGVGEQPYNIPNYRVTGYQAPDLLPAGWLRSVGESQNSFFHESVIDELAYAAALDPLQMRLDLIKHEPSRAVLTKVAEISSWSEPLPPNQAQGVAYVLSSDAATAQVVQVRKTETGIEVVKVYAVVDVGIALDPANIEAQVKSGIIFGLSAAINGEITVSNGKVDQTNFHQYSPLRIYQAPPIEVQIIESGTEIYGVGESGTPAAAPALGNAIYAATGLRIRELPFAKHIRFQ